MINKLNFKNYKIFKNFQTLELKPITIIIGKNSSGKSAVLKLPTLIEGAFSDNFPEPIRLINKGVEIGGEFSDLVYSRSKVGRIEFIIENDVDKLNVILGSGTRSNDKPEILYYSLNSTVIDVSAENFRGFIPVSQKGINFKLKTDYISSKRDGIERSFGKPNHYNCVGLKGENVYSILIEDAISLSTTLLNDVSDFYKNNFEGWSINVNEDLSPFYQIELVKGNLKVNLVDVGLGMIHALPLVTRAFSPVDEETLIIIEEPELHLHPAAHGNLAQLFAESTQTDSRKKYLIETHSQNFVLRLRRLIAQGDLNKDDVVIYYVNFNEQSNESKLEKITIDEYGKPRDSENNVYWPANIFSETLDETSAIRAAQLKKQSNGSSN